jgi:L-ascorbate metabolism protein UlaG (beta-lactamase superfamily)
MHIEKFDHACLLLETPNARVLIDPGTFSRGFEELRDLSAIVFTHAHADHLDESRVPALVAANPEAAVIADPGSAQVLAGHGITATVAEPGLTFQVGEPLEVIGKDHAVIHADIPVIPNTGFLFAGRLFHPGDALTVPGRDIEILALPVVAPWMRTAEGVEYLRTVSPSVAIPIHEAIASNPQMYYKYYASLGPAGLQLLVADDKPLDL